jgi:hypothetical protein
MSSCKKSHFPIHEPLMQILVFSIKLPIIIYRLTFSSIIGHNCRYYPTCSAYSLEAINAHGPFKGIVLSVKRLARCHPWNNHSGVDPVPSSHRK